MVRVLLDLNITYGTIVIVVAVYEITSVSVKKRPVVRQKVAGLDADNVFDTTELAAGDLGFNILAGDGKHIHRAALKGHRAGGSGSALPVLIE